PARRLLCGQDPQGREARRPSNRAAHQNRTGDQPQDRQSAWLDDSAGASAAGGSSDRVIERRTFLGVIAGGLLAAPLAAEAQQAGKVYRLGSIVAEMPTTPPDQGPFNDRMRELGWVYGQNYVVERRVYGDQLERIPDLA